MVLKGVNRDDPLWLALNDKDVYTRADLRKIGKKWNIKTGGKYKAELADEIYIKLKKGVKVDKPDTIDYVVVENHPNEALVFIRDKTDSGEDISIDLSFPKPIKKIRIKEIDKTNWEVIGTTLDNEVILNRTTVTESFEQQVARSKQEPKYKTSFKDGKIWKEKPIPKPVPHYLSFKKHHIAGKLDRPLNEKGKEQKRIYNKYIKQGLIPIFHSVNSASMVDPVHFVFVPEAEWVAESGEKMSGFLTARELKDYNKFRSLSGNQTQTRIDKDGNFVGIYYKTGTIANPIPYMFKPEKIRADPDAIGQMQAWYLNTYVNKNLKLKNVVDVKGKTDVVDFKLAMRGLTGSIVDSKAYYRNGIARQAIKDAFGDSALAYLPKGASKAEDLSLSDQQVRAAGLIVQDTMDIEVQTPDFVVTFPFKVRKFREKKPKLIFKPLYNPLVEPLDSDSLLLIATRQMKMEAITVQNLLEALYQQKWINYPRANIVKAEAEPIQIRNPKTGEIIENGKQAQQLVNDSVTGFHGSLHEKQLLDIIVRSQIAYDDKKPFIQRGAWYLVSGDLQLESKVKTHTLLVGEPIEYSADQFDINVGERGILEDDLVKQLVEEDVATPATRTAMLEELKSAGVLSRRSNRLVVDRRGYYIAALDNYYTSNNVERSYYLKNIIYGTKEISKMSGIVDAFDWFTLEKKGDIRKFLVQDVAKMIEAESDLAYLDREGEI